MNLNIIGNGFDLYHGLPSSYYYFGCYLIDNEPELYEEIGDMYDFIFRKPSSGVIDYEYELVIEDIFWRDFEKHLGYVNEGFILYTYPDELGLENDDPIDIEMNEDNIAEHLKEAFAKWVMETLDQDVNFECIAKYMRDNSLRLKFSNDDYYLNFNYTRTLQKIYNISDKNIYFVHGEAGDSELIVGHGNTERIVEINTKLAEFEDKCHYTQSSRNEENEHRCLLRYIESLKKNVELCMYGCERFYSSIHRNIKNVIIWGMSMGEVDLPYFKQIRQRYPNAKWSFSYFSEDDKKRNKEVAENYLKLAEEEWKGFEFNNLIYSKIQNEIEDLQKIKRFEKV